MKYLINLIVGVLATLVYFLGGWDVPLQILITAVILDYISGVLKAIYHKKLNSEIGAKGIIKKVSFFVAVAIAVLVDKITGETGAVRTLVIYFFVANEGISILENLGSMNIPIPKKLLEILEQLKTNDK